MPTAPSLPYFDVLLEGLKRGHPTLSQAFGVHVHWGYWETPGTADGSVQDFAHAAERMSQRVCDAAGVLDGQRILDAGSGLGGTVSYLNRRLEGARLVGLNIDPRQLAYAREQVLPRSSNRIEFVEGDACAMPFADASFNAVIALESVFHFSDRPRFLSEVQRVLAPGGRLVIADFIPALMPSFLAWAQRMVLGAYMRNVLGPADVSYTVARYREAARRAGLVFRLEDDITSNTSPTYPVLRHVSGEMGRHAATAKLGVSVIDWLSRVGLLRYVVLGFERTGVSPLVGKSRDVEVDGQELGARGDVERLPVRTPEGDVGRPLGAEGAE